LIITGEEGGSVKLWSIAELEVEEEVDEHEGPVTSASFAGSADRVYSASLDGFVHFLDRASNNPFQLPHMHPITASDIAGDASVVVVGESRLRAPGKDWRNTGDASINACASGFVSAWDISSHWGATQESLLEQPLWRIDLASRKVEAATGPQSPTFIRVSPDARLVAFSRKIGGTNPGELEIVGLRDGRSGIPTYWGNPGNAPVAAEFSACGETILIVTWEGLLLMEREVSQRSCTTIRLEEPERQTKWGSETEWLAALRSDTLRAPWWAPSAVSASVDSRYLLMGSREGKIRVYDVPNRRRVVQLAGHRGEVTAVKFFSSMEYALSAGMDCTLRIWRLPQLETS
jgi:hypothetical protein